MPFDPMWRQADVRAVIPLLGGIPQEIGGRYPVFAAYPYALDPAYREILRRVEARAAVRFVFPEDDASPAHLDEKVLALLHIAAFAIFDWSGWNANVAFEFGLALGEVSSRPAMRGVHRRSRLAIFIRTGAESDVPSDLGGMGRNRYADLGDLGTQLEAILSARFPLRPASRRPP